MTTVMFEDAFSSSYEDEGYKKLCIKFIVPLLI